MRSNTVLLGSCEVISHRLTVRLRRPKPGTHHPLTPFHSRCHCHCRCFDTPRVTRCPVPPLDLRPRLRPSVPLSKPKPEPSLARAHTKAPAPANSPLPAGTGWLANLSRCLDPQRGSQTQQRRPSPSNSSSCFPSGGHIAKTNPAFASHKPTTTTREPSSNEGRIRAGAFPAPVPPLPPPPPARSLPRRRPRSSLLAAQPGPS